MTAKQIREWTETNKKRMKHETTIKRKPQRIIKRQQRKSKQENVNKNKVREQDQKLFTTRSEII
jgi:hypothetical protein